MKKEGLRAYETYLLEKRPELKGISILHIHTIAQSLLKSSDKLRLAGQKHKKIKRKR